MKATLGIDTSCGFTVLGLAEGNRVTAESRWELGRAQASLLPSLVRQLLQPFHLTLEDLEVLAVTVGPGAYTGLRIGVAYAAALADALGIRVVPLSTLEVLAEEAPPGELPVAVSLRARKGHLYGAAYVHHPEGVRVLQEPAFLSEQEFLGLRRGWGKGYHVGLSPEEIEWGNSVNWIPLPRSSPSGAALVRAGLRRASEALSPETLRIAYLREPDFGPKGCV